MNEQLHFHFSLSCIGEGNGNPLQCSCLENPRTGEPGGLTSVGSHRVGHDLSDLAAAAAALPHGSFAFPLRQVFLYLSLPSPSSIPFTFPATLGSPSALHS